MSSSAHDGCDGPAANGDPLYSPLASDSSLVDLVESFVAALPARGAALRSAHEAGNLAEVRSLAHSLKGAAGSYGFLPITEACAALEGRLEGPDESAIEAGIEAIAILCERATSRPAP